MIGELGRTVFFMNPIETKTMEENLVRESKGTVDYGLDIEIEKVKKNYLSNSEVDKVILEAKSEARIKEMKRMVRPIKDDKQQLIEAPPKFSDIVPPKEIVTEGVPNELKNLVNTEFTVTGFEIFPSVTFTKSDGSPAFWAKVAIKDCSISEHKDGYYRTSSEILMSDMKKVEETIKKGGIRVKLIKVKRYFKFT